MSARTDRGWKWFKTVMWLLFLAAVIKALVAAGQGDQKLFETAIMMVVGGAVIVGLPAFALGWVVDPIEKKIQPMASNASDEPVSVKPADIVRNSRSPTPGPTPADSSSSTREKATRSPELATPQMPSNTSEDQAYEQVALELENNTPNKGLWTRAFAQCDGEERATKVLYIKLRVEQLISAEQAKRNAENQQIESAKIIRDREHFSRMDARSQILCLISSGARVAIPDDSDVFLHLLRKGDESQLGEFLERDVRYLAATESGTGNSPLHVAIVERNIQIAKFLIEFGASIKVANNYGLTPLDFAKSTSGMQEIAEIMAEVQQFRANAGATEVSPEKGLAC